MDTEEFDAFCEDVEQRGILMPLTLYEGMILDGWHRYRASKRTGSAFELREYKGKDPAGYISSVNVLRRRLSSLQRCLVAARLHLDHAYTQRDVCRKLGVSNEIVSMCIKVLNLRNAVLIKRIEEDSEYTRGMLREELQDLGVVNLRPKDLAKLPPPPQAPTGPNSVFQAGEMAAADEEEEPEPDPVLVGKGKKASDRKEKAPKATAAQLLAEQFRALMADEKATFLQMIWPEAKDIADTAGLLDPAPHPAQKAPAAKKAAKK